MIWEVVFWGSVALVAYAWVGFPALLALRAGLVRRARHETAFPAVDPEPTVSLIIVAHNEAASLGSKIENTAALDYPAAKLEVIVASDGSTDGTDEIVRRHARPGLALLDLPRTGKIPALNAAVQHARGDILVFSDANSLFRTDALRALLEPFRNPAVGAVGGNQRYRADGPDRATGGLAALGERLYWSYDRMLKSLQSRSGSMTSATGALHAIRRSLFKPVPLGVSDDFVISTRAIEQGRRLAFAERAVAYEALAPGDRAEFERKLRVVTRGLRGLWVMRRLFNPVRYGFYSLQLASHKLLRWAQCWVLLALLASSVALVGQGGVYGAFLIAQVCFYGLATAGAVLSARGRGAPYASVVAVPFYVCLAYAATLRAWLEVGSGRRVDAWDSTHTVTAGS